MTGPSLATGVFPKAGGGGGGGSGNVTGPDAAADGNFAAFDGADGKKIRDGGVSASSFATAAQGLLASTALQPGAQIPWTDVADKPAFGSAALQDASAFAAAVHTHTASQISDASANGRSLIMADDYAAMRVLLSLVKGTAAGNIPVLDGGGKLDTSILPALAITETFVVNSQSAMLALTAQTGDVAIRTDLNKTFILSTNNPGTLADWKEMLTPTDAVLSVAGLTGAISASALKTALAIAVADVTDMSVAGRLFVALSSYANMFNAIKQAATDTATGVVELATNAEAIAGTDTSRAVTPAGLAAAIAAGGGSVIKSITYYDVAAPSLSSGSGVETKYFDVTVTGTNAAKMVADFQGTAHEGSRLAVYFAASTTTVTAAANAKVRSATSVRIGCPEGIVSQINGRLRVVEYN